MKSYKNLFIAFLILFGSFAVALAEEDDDSIGEFIGDIFAFIIGDMIGSCVGDTECRSIFGPSILYIVVGMIILSIVLHCCCNFDDDYHPSRRYNRRAAMFGAGMGWGAIRNR
jgi:hypothetical protein